MPYHLVSDKVSGEEGMPVSARAPERLGRRSFLVGGAALASAMALTGLRSWAFGEARRPYALAPESVLPPDIQRAPAQVREAYRFAISPARGGSGGESQALRAEV